jgi:hypothetical protein
VHGDYLFWYDFQIVAGSKSQARESAMRRIGQSWTPSPIIPAFTAITQLQRDHSNIGLKLVRVRVTNTRPTNPTQQFGQLGDIRRDPARLIFC